MNALRAYLEALFAAKHDADLERRGYEIYHFFDSDFLHRVVFGYLDEQNRHLIDLAQQADRAASVQQQLLMSALFGQHIGVPPRIRALPPHLAELRTHIDRARAYAPRGRVEQVIDSLGLRQLLVEIVKEPQDRKGGRVTDLLITEGPTLFYGLEMLSGSWQSRLIRLLELDLHGGSPFDTDAEVVGTDLFSTMSRHVGHPTDEKRHPRASVNALRDAMTLTMLAQDIQSRWPQFLGNPSLPIARFYTETPRIRKAWNVSGGLRRLLTYPSNSHHQGWWDERIHGVMRSEYYYLVRALIPELRYYSPGEPEPVTGFSDYYQLTDKLRKVGDQVEQGIVTDPNHPDLRLTEELTASFALVTELSSYDRGWKRLIESTPRVPQTIAKELESVQKRERQLAPALERRFRELVDDLATRTEDLKGFSEVYVDLAGLLGQEPRVPLRPNRGSYAQHLGVVRWGFEDVGDLERRILHMVDAYEEWKAEAAQDDRSHPPKQGFVVDLARRLWARHMPRDLDEVGDLVALLGLLWILEDYAGVAHHAELIHFGVSQRLGGYQDDDQSYDDELDEAVLVRLRGALANIRAAAMTRSTLPTLAPRQILQQVRRDVTRLTVEQDEAGLPWEATAITQGYILFHAWQHVNPAAMDRLGSARSVSRLPEFAADSFDICYDALGRCSPDSNYYLLLLNHCLYVGAVANHFLEHPKLETELTSAFSIRRESDRQLWTYRFDDTLAFLNFSRAKRAVVAFRTNDQSGPELLDRANEGINVARRWFNQISTDLRDGDIVMHVQLLEDLQLELDLLTNR